LVTMDVHGTRHAPRDETFSSLARIMRGTWSRRLETSSEMSRIFALALAKILGKSKTYRDGLDVELPAVGSVGFQAWRRTLDGGVTVAKKKAAKKVAKKAPAAKKVAKKAPAAKKVAKKKATKKPAKKMAMCCCK
jgi:hypothetical protein